MKFSELQDQLKEKFGIEHLADMARELGGSPQAVSNWKARDRVPYKYVLKIREKLKESDRWSEGASVFGLPKVRVQKLVLKKKKKEKVVETEEGQEAPAAGEDKS